MEIYHGPARKGAKRILILFFSMHHGNNGQHSIDNELYLNVIQHMCIIIVFDIIDP